MRTGQTRTRGVVVAAALAIITAAACGGVLYAHSQWQPSGDWQPHTVTTVCPGHAATPSSTLPLVHPRNDCTPAFTAQDVRDARSANLN